MQGLLNLKFFFKKIPLDILKSRGGLSGFSKRNKKRETLGIKSLHISILWVKEPEEDIIFISIDTLYISHEISDTVYQLIAKIFQISKDKIIFNATHTHSAPSIVEVYDKEIYDKEYKDYIVQSIVKVFAEDKIEFWDGNIFSSSRKISEQLLVARRKEGRDIRSFF